MYLDSHINGICNLCLVVNYPAVFSDKARCALWENLFNHLAAHGTSLLGGQVAVVALLQGHANLVGSFHLETVEAFASFGTQVFVASPNFVHSVTFCGYFHRCKMFAFAFIILVFRAVFITVKMC